MKKRIISAALVLCVTTTACASRGSRLSEEAAFTEKYNAYIELLNFASGRWFNSVVDVYFGYFGYDMMPNATDADFTGGFLFSRGTSETPDLFELYSKEFETPRKLVNSSPSFGAADDDALILADAMEALMHLYFVTINDYYESGDYKEDNFAKAGEYHVEMLLSYIDFLDALESFSISFEEVILEYQGKDLEVFQKQGWDIHYYMLKIVLTARQISNMFQLLNSQNIDFLDADINAFEPLYDSLISDINELFLIYGNESKHSAENLSGMQVNRLTFFVQTAQDLETAATDTLNMIKAGTTDIPNEYSGQVTTGGRYQPMSNFDRRLDILIDYYNQVIS